MPVELRGVRWDQGRDGKGSRGFPTAGEGGLDRRQLLRDRCVDGQLLWDSSECAPLMELQKANAFRQTKVFNCSDRNGTNSTNAGTKFSNLLGIANDVT